MKTKRKSRRETTPKTTQFAKALRQRTTPAEKLLWSRLRRDALGFHFRRQAPVGKFILDFYCVKAKLAIEVDGDIHIQKIDRDFLKAQWLQNQKRIHIIRVTNQEVMDNLEGVIIFILNALHSPPPLPSPVRKNN